MPVITSNVQMTDGYFVEDCLSIRRALELVRGANLRELDADEDVLGYSVAIRSRRGSRALSLVVDVTSEQARNRLSKAYGEKPIHVTTDSSVSDLPIVFEVADSITTSGDFQLRSWRGKTQRDPVRHSLAQRLKDAFASIRASFII